MMRIVFTLLMLCASLSMLAQDLVQGLRHSPYTYIFSLSNQEAAQAYADRLEAFNPAYTDVLVDSFLTGKAYHGQLPYGNYLFVYAKEEQLLLSLESVHNTRLNLLPDAHKIVAAVLDTEGIPIRNAKVWVDGKNMPLHAASGTYQRRFKKNYKMVVVEHAGLQNFYPLQHNGSHYSLARRVLNRVIYFKPVRLVWRPFQSIYRSIRWGQLDGWLRIFDADERDSMWGSDKPFGGFMALNQPTYRQGDTVRYKAFVLKKHNPYKKELAVSLTGRTRNGQKTFRLANLKPYLPGAYEGYFILHDSLGFLLDTYPTISLNKGAKSLGTQFRFEDYELRGNVFSMRATQSKHVKGAPPTIIIRGTDVNDLSLLGGEVKLVALVRSAEILPETTYHLVPDTLWEHKLSLKAVGDTQLVLPDSLFGPVPLHYTLHAVLKTAQQEFLKQSVDLQYAPEQMLDLSLEGDTLRIRYLKGAESLAVTAQVEIKQREANAEKISTVFLPYKIKIKPGWQEVAVWAAGEQERFMFNQKPPLVAHAIARTDDSLLISMTSGRQLPFWYSVYKGKRRKKKVASGYSGGEPVLWEAKTNQREVYFLQLSWIWGGQLQQTEEDIPLLKNRLYVAVDAPDQVKPGDKLPVVVQVKNRKGQPVAGVDVTALAYNKKMPGQMQPQVPYLGKEAWRPLRTLEKRRNEQNTFASKKLEWQQWKQRLGLDSIAFYRFLYPQQEVYTSSLPTPDSSTQLAPYVVRDGFPEQVHILYLNDIPVFYNEVETHRAYSFVVTPGKPYKLSMRTANYLVTLDSIKVEKGKKLVLSVNPKANASAARVEKMLPRLTEAELNYLNKYLVIIDHTYNQNYTYLQQGEQLQMLGHNVWGSHNRPILAGPFNPAEITYEVLDQFKTSFPLETNSRYRIQPSLVYAKRDIPEKESGLNFNRMNMSLDALALTKAQVQKNWQAYLNEQKKASIKYDYPSSTKAGSGRISLGYKVAKAEAEQDQQILQEVVVISLSDTGLVQVYPVRSRLAFTNQTLHNLPPGSYKFVGMLDNGQYLQADSVPVAANTTTQLNLRLLQEKGDDKFMDQIRQIIENSVSRRMGLDKLQQRELAYINQVSRMQTPRTGTSAVSGVVTDERGEPLPGVTVMVKGTNTGTVTDMSGYYELYVMPGEQLVISFIGYSSEEVTVGYEQSIEVSLAEDVEMLQEVVVVGYGEQKQSMVTGAVAALQGRVAGVHINGDPGAQAMIRIRGASGIDEANQPFYIVDGVPIQGGLADLDSSQIASMVVLKGEAATAIYGSRAAGGAIIITTGKKQTEKQHTAASAMGGAMQQNSLRTNFRDWAFWQPRLQTDALGEAHFTVNFPDNITAWEAKVLAMGRRRYSGQQSKTIKAIKPLWAALAMPRFLLTGDSALIYGQVSNYNSDTLEVNTRFTIGSRQEAVRQSQMSSSLKDSSWVSTLSLDSLSVTYEVSGQEGLLDGERRKLPVYRTGVREAKGELLILRPDSVKELSLAAGQHPWQLQAFGSSREPLLHEINYLWYYPYLCNEQVASKLYALLLQNAIRQEQDMEPQRLQRIRRMIRHLSEAQLENGRWGWWPGNEGELWITRHVVGALILAREQGHAVKFNADKLLQDLDWNLKASKNPHEQLEILEVLSQLKATQVPYQEYLPSLEAYFKKDEFALLRILRVKAAAGLSFEAADVLALKHETALGAYYWGEQQHWQPEQSSLVATAWAYELLQQKGATEAADKAVLYLWTNRPGGHWRNTYESAQVLLQLVPQLSLHEQLKPSLSLQAMGESRSFTELPFEQPQEIAAGSVSLKNSGNTPLYVTAYTESWIDKPQPKGEDFTITTSFSKNQLLAGEAVEMKAEVKIKKTAEYVMIEIPIPAGCTYEEKKSRWPEIHREYFRDRVVIFCRQLPEGTHTFSLNLLPRFKGTYQLNPAQVSLMYFPTIFGRSGMQVVEIK